MDTNVYQNIDGYVRNRLRVAFANRGKRSGRYRERKILTVKYPNNFFMEVMGLVTGTLLVAQEWNPKITKEEYVNKSKRKSRKDPTRKQFFE